MKSSARNSLLLALLFSAGAAMAQAKMDETKGMDMAKKPSAGVSAKHMTTGLVKKVDAKTGVVTLAHEPVKTLNWPAMTMGFKVKDKMLMDKLGEGKKVAFEFMQDGNDYVITDVK